jgi:hypothetical protein
MNTRLTNKSAMHKTYRLIRILSLLLVFLTIGPLSITGCASLAQRTVPPVTVSRIVQMSHDGVPPGTIIQRIAESGTVYRLSASELANLRDDGVADAVINYMQQTYLGAVRRDQSAADQNLWVYGPDGYYYGGYPFGWPYDYVPYAPESEQYQEEESERRAAANSHPTVHINKPAKK